MSQNIYFELWYALAAGDFRWPGRLIHGYSNVDSCNNNMLLSWLQHSDDTVILRNVMLYVTLVTYNNYVILIIWLYIMMMGWWCKCYLMSRPPNVCRTPSKTLLYFVVTPTSMSRVSVKSVLEVWSYRWNSTMLKDFANPSPYSPQGVGWKLRNLASIFDHRLWRALVSKRTNIYRKCKTSTSTSSANDWPSLWLGHFAHASPNFIGGGVRSAKVCVNLASGRCSFETKQHI